jgi:hypothetical protein
VILAQLPLALDLISRNKLADGDES